MLDENEDSTMHGLQVETFFRVPKLMCERCAAALAGAVRMVDDAARVEADLAARTVRVVSTRSESALITTLREAGFPAEPVLQPLG